MDNYLSYDDIVEMTGYKRKHEQTRWLNSNGYPYSLDRFSRPKVLWETVRTRHGLTKPQTSIKWDKVA